MLSHPGPDDGWGVDLYDECRGTTLHTTQFEISCANFRAVGLKLGSVHGIVYAPLRFAVQRKSTQTAVLRLGLTQHVDTGISMVPDD